MTAQKMLPSLSKTRGKGDINRCEKMLKNGFFIQVMDIIYPCLTNQPPNY